MKRTIKGILLVIPVIAGAISLSFILLNHSEEKSSLLFGLSALRLCLAAFQILLILIAFLFFIRRPLRQSYLFYFSGIAALTIGEILLFSLYPCDDTRNLIPLITEKARPLLLWFLTAAFCWFFTALISVGKAPDGFGFFLLAVGGIGYLIISSYVDRYNWKITLTGNTPICLMMLFSGGLWFLLLRSDADRGWKTAAGVLFFSLLGFGVTRLTGMWMGRRETPPNAYWNELAESFLGGRLFLTNPSGTHDLTLYDGRWYVPNPPLPALLLVPFVRLFGSGSVINTCVYSAILTGICAGSFFLLLILALSRPDSPLAVRASDETAYPGKSLSAACWVTVLFTFGTDLLWLGTTGQMWFISQLVVVLFTLLACICSFCRFSPVLSGICLGLAVLSRPNVFPIFLCLLGIQLYQEREFPLINWKRTLIWCLKCGIPVVISAGILLLYNHLRFDSWTDFGYVTINGADWILDSVRKYGMFHPHFLPINADVMLFGLPRLDFSGGRFFFQPYTAGYSVFLMTPSLIYIFRSFRKNWFAVGTWASVLLTATLLLFYHNTGAEQIGYRYMLDAAAPLALLTADGMHGKAGSLFKILTVFSVTLSFIGIIWWYLGRV